MAKKQKPMMATCMSCGWRGREDRLQPIKDVWERLSPGEPYWDGDCPKCGCASYTDETAKGMADRLTRNAEPLLNALKKLLSAIDEQVSWAGNDFDPTISAHKRTANAARKVIAKAEADMRGKPS